MLGVGVNFEFWTCLSISSTMEAARSTALILSAVSFNYRCILKSIQQLPFTFVKKPNSKIANDNNS